MTQVSLDEYFLMESKRRRIICVMKAHLISLLDAKTVKVKGEGLKSLWI